MVTNEVQIVWTCPMHPEVEEPKPGACPHCGMDLEPKDPGARNDDEAILNHRRRFLLALLFTLPVFTLAMGKMLPWNWASDWFVIEGGEWI